MLQKTIVLFAAAATILGCSDGAALGPDASLLGPDRDNDGFRSPEDCNDDDRSIYPGAPEPCDGVDNDCDGDIDDGHDLDGDRWTTCAGDCRDNHPASFPGAPERADGYDNDCDGLIDNNTGASDDDGDGFTEDQGDCNDDPAQGGELIGPQAVEVQLSSDGEPEGLDNDCDGLIDEALEPCPVGGDHNDPYTYVNAIDACHFTLSAWWNQGIAIDPRSRNIFSRFGSVYTPLAGSDFAVFSTGIAGDRSFPLYDNLSTNLNTQAPHPDPQGSSGCSSADPTDVNDYTEVVLRMLVPANASAFSFDFNFMSIEFPEWVCSSFDDTFLALLESDAFTGNASFDAMGNRVSINVGFFDVCQFQSGYPTETAACTGVDDLGGTGFGGTTGGGTGWLTTTAPVVPGEKITLRFAIFDEGDHSLDSAVIIDNFRWQIDEVMCPGGTPPPCTIGREQAPRSRFVAAPIAPLLVR